MTDFSIFALLQSRIEELLRRQEQDPDFKLPMETSVELHPKQISAAVRQIYERAQSFGQCPPFIGQENVRSNGVLFQYFGLTWRLTPNINA